MDFSGLQARVDDVRGEIAEAVARGGHGQQVRLIAVTKTHPVDAVVAAWRAGVVDVGENKVQEAVAKQDALAESGVAVPGLTWHLIGHLQTNKVKALPHFSLFHALDRARLADAISSFAASRGLTVDVLVQVNVVGEATKGGYAPSDVASEGERLMSLSGLRVRGVMTMAPFDADERVLRTCFAGARAAAAQLRRIGHPATELSMGMSGDYAVAVEEGATLVRLGTALFGSRS